MFWLLTLPFRLAFWMVLGVVLLPFLLIRVFVKLVVGLVMLPVILAVAFAGMLVAIVVGGVMFSIALLPLAPIALVVFLVWALTRHSRVASATPN